MPGRGEPQSVAGSQETVLQSLGWAACALSICVLVSASTPWQVRKDVQLKDVEKCQSYMNLILMQIRKSAFQLRSNGLSEVIQTFLIIYSFISFGTQDLLHWICQAVYYKQRLCGT